MSIYAIKQFHQQLEQAIHYGGTSKETAIRFAESKNYLGNRKEFDLDKDVIVDFCKFAVNFFENV